MGRMEGVSWAGCSRCFGPEVHGHQKRVQGRSPSGSHLRRGAGLEPELGCCTEAKALCTHHWAVASSVDRPRECPPCRYGPHGAGVRGPVCRARAQQGAS